MKDIVNYGKQLVADAGKLAYLFNCFFSELRAEGGGFNAEEEESVVKVELTDSFRLVSGSDDYGFDSDSIDKTGFWIPSEHLTLSFSME